MPSPIQQFSDTFAQNKTAVASGTVSAGNSVVVVTLSYGGGILPNIGVTDGTAYTLADRGQNDEVSGQFIEVSVHYRHNHPGGSITVTATNAGNASDCYGHLRVFEVPGLVNTTPNQSTTNFPVGSSGSTTPSSGTTAATTQPDCWILSALTANSVGTDGGIDVPATTGYTNLFVDQSSSVELAGSIDHKTVASTGTQSAAWGTLSLSAPWVGCIVAFQANAPSASAIAAISNYYKSLRASQ